MLGNISAIATLILFVIYFIGRIITIIIEKNMVYDKISFECSDNLLEQYDIVEEIVTANANRNEADCPTIVVLTSVQGIWNLKISEISYDKEFNEQKKFLKTIATYDFLNIGQSYAVHTDIPEIFPLYRIQYRTQDFKKVVFDVSYNLKNGVLSEMLVSKHTIKSIIYYLFK